MASRTDDVAVPLQDPKSAGALRAVRVPAVARALYAAAVAALGFLLLSSKLAYVWAPIPKWVPGRQELTVAAGAVMLVAALGVVWRKTAGPASVILTALFLSWLLLLQVPRIIAAPARELLWSGGAQLTSVVAGGWIVVASVAAGANGAGRWLSGVHALRLARSLYAVALPVFGLHHFADVNGAAEAVPAWLPLRTGWVYLTGAGHVAAGVAILLGILPRLAAKLEAIMITAFVVLVHVPGVLGAPGDPLQWTMLIVASAICGAAWIVAGTYGADAPPGRRVPPPVTSP
jgi:uncharacterized membrane protein